MILRAAKMSAVAIAVKTITYSTVLCPLFFLNLFILPHPLPLSLFKGKIFLNKIIQ